MSNPDAVLNECMHTLIRFSLAEPDKFFGGAVEPQAAVNLFSGLLDDFMNRWSSWKDIDLGGNKESAKSIVMGMLRDVESSRPAEAAGCGGCRGVRLPFWDCSTQCGSISASNADKQSTWREPNRLPPRKVVEAMVATLLIAASLKLSAGSMMASDCTVEDVRFYEKTESVGNGAPVYTRFCASFTIRNNSGGSRFDANVKASFADNTSDSVKVQTPRLQTGDTYPADICFGTVRVRELSCAW